MLIKMYIYVIVLSIFMLLTYICSNVKNGKMNLIQKV